jgi:hypothetical protein
MAMESGVSGLPLVMGSRAIEDGHSQPLTRIVARSHPKIQLLTCSVDRQTGTRTIDWAVSNISVSATVANRRASVIDSVGSEA